MNKVVTSREAILEESRKLVMKEGLLAINMRSVANACGVAVGSIYNYFPSKADLIAATVEDVFRDIFHMSKDCFSFSSFEECLIWLFDGIKKGCNHYPGFFNLHSMSFASHEKAKGREMMEQYFVHIKKGLLHVLEQDPNVREDAFNDILTKEAFIEIIFSVFTSMLLKEQEDCNVLLEMVRRCIYRKDS